jgi:hypothetical protein
MLFVVPMNDNNLHTTQQFIYIACTKKKYTIQYTTSELFDHYYEYLILSSICSLKKNSTCNKLFFCVCTINLNDVNINILIY